MNRHFPCGHWHKKSNSPVCGRVKVTNYAFKSAMGAVARVVRYIMSPFARSGTYDIFPNGLDYIDYGSFSSSTYDVTTGKVFIGVNGVHDDIDTLSVVVVQDEPFAYRSTIVLVTGPYGTINENIEAMCSYSEGGFVYVYTRHTEGTTLKVYEIDTSTESVTRTATLAADGDGPVPQRNAMWVDASRGYIYWAAKYADEGYGHKYIVGFNLSTLAIDKVSDKLTTNHWGINGCAYDRCTGTIYVTHPIGPTYYPTHYAVSSINVDTMATIETIELNSPAIVNTHHVECTATHIYLLGKLTSTGTNDYCIATCTRSPLVEIDRVTIVTAASGGLYQEAQDMKIDIADNQLIVVGRAYVSNKYVSIDQTYDITSGAPVLATEILTDDPDWIERGDLSSTLTCGEVFQSG